MAINRLSSVLHQLLRSVAPATAGEVSDAELLDRFVGRRDEAAFELLIWRHGPMVLGLCQRLLHDQHDAEDAFQATFLILVRKARSIGKRDALASWLYKVAYRVACRARPRVPVVSNVNVILDELPARPNDEPALGRDLRGQLDQEIARLPESYRRAIVLCYLEGKTQDEAARLLGWPTGTVATRLKRARERLHLRLGRRGWAVSSIALAGVLANQALAIAIPAALVRSTLGGALAYAAGSVAAGTVVSAKSLALTEGVLRIMWYSKMKFMASVFLAVVLAGGGVGLAVRQAWAGAGEEDAKASQADPVPVIAQTKVVKGGKGTASSAEVADLRREVETLRRDLETALREINDLKAGQRLPGLPPEKGPLFRGRPASFWLEQLKDADPDYRTDGVKALGALAQQQKSLIPVLVGALKDRNYKVQTAASAALEPIGPEVVPLLVDLLKDQSAGACHGYAITTLGKFGREAKAAVPLIILYLNDPDPKSKDWSSAIATLHQIGPDAKAAIPTMVETLNRVLLLWRERKFEITYSTSGLLGSIISALAAIDPSSKEALPKELLILAESGMPFSQRGGSVWNAGGLGNSRQDLSSQFQQAYEQLKKKYPPIEK